MKDHPSRRARWLLLAGAAITTAGLFAAVVPAGAATGAQAADGPAVPVLNWQPCTGAGEAGFDCATAQVPLNYQDPHGQMIQLAVIKHPATNPAQRIGSLFFNPGGPGDPGTTYLPEEYQFFPAAVRARYDIISWDPRGVGQSTDVQCFSSPTAEANFFADLPAGFPVGAAQQATWISLYAKFAKICEQADPTLLSHVSTADSARDLDLLRQAVGDPVLNYYGVSYGTYLGATYANLFPDKVGAMVLDGNVDPTSWATPQEANSIPLSVEIRLQQDLGSAATLGQFLKLCGQAATTDCKFSAGTAAATTAKYDQLLADLNARPVTISIPAFGGEGATGSITFTYASTVSFLSDVLLVAQPELPLAPGWGYGAFVLQTLWTAIHTAATSTSTADPPTAAQASSGPLPEWGYATVCADSPNPKNPAAYQAEAAFTQQRTGAMGPLHSWGDEPCAAWEATDADGYFGPWNHPTAHPLLLVGNLYDPATPYQDSVAMASQLASARLLTLDGYGHTALDNPSSCIQNYEAAYLITGTLPPPGTVCQLNQQPFTTSNG